MYHNAPHISLPLVWLQESDDDFRVIEILGTWTVVQDMCEMKYVQSMPYSPCRSIGYGADPTWYIFVKIPLQFLGHVSNIICFVGKNMSTTYGDQ